MFPRSPRLFPALLLALAAPISRAHAACDAEARLARERTALDRWQDAVRARAPKTTRLPYPMSAEYTARFLKLPYEIPDFPAARVYLTYFEHPRSIAPVMRRRESWHAEVRYLEGYNYVLSFAEPAARGDFLASFPQVQVPDGELEGRHTVILTPAQFFAMSQVHDVRGTVVEREIVRETTRNELKFLGWAPLSGAALRYFFGDRGEVVGLRRGHRFYVVVPRNENARRTAASHFDILRLQNPTLDLSRFLRPDGAVPSDFGLIQADREIESVETALARHFERPEFSPAGASGRVIEAEVLGAKFFVDPAPSFALFRWIGHRLESLKWIEGAGPRQLAHDLARPHELVCRGPAGVTQAFRFVWIRDLHPSAGLLLGRRGLLLHHQMLALAVGPGVRGKLVDLGGVRGGTIAIRFDRAGRPEKFLVDDGEMRSSSSEGQPRELAMTSAERQALVLELFNFCQEPYR